MSEFVVQKTGTAGLVTIDVEPDNVWADTHSRSLENIRHLLRFHRLCQEYGVRPTYLVSWSVANNGNCVNILEELLRHGDCEIGIHPHLWETPPFTEQDESNQAWVGSQYSTDVLEAKITSLNSLIGQRFGTAQCHRAGRWGLDIRQVRILSSLGIRIDTSVIPGIDWSSTGIPDYSRAPLQPYLMAFDNLVEPGTSGLLQVPCTIRPGVRFYGLEKNRYVSSLMRRIGWGNQWLRVAPTNSVENLLETCSWAIRSLPHLNLMSHSSEFMAGGSPYWRTEADIARKFDAYEHIFKWWSKNGIEPKTLSEFGSVYKPGTSKGPQN